MKITIEVLTNAYQLTIEQEGQKPSKYAFEQGHEKSVIQKVINDLGMKTNLRVEEK